MKQITAKLGNMRKAQDWVVYPYSRTSDNTILIQCDKRICQFDPTTGKGMISDGKNGHQGFHKLMPMMGAKEVTVPQEVITAAQDTQPQVGQSIGAGVTIG